MHARDYQRHFGGKTVVAVVCLLRVLARNVVVAKTSYQMLEILSFSDRKRALPLSTEISVLFQPLSVNSLMHDQPRPKCFGLSITRQENPHLPVILQNGKS